MARPMSQALSLTTDPIARLTWRIALPMSVGMFFNTMFNVVDTYCAGWLGTEAQAALSLSFPVFFLVIAVGSGLSQGATALMANALGAGRPEEARHVLAQSLLFALGAGLALSVLGLLVAPLLFRLLGAEGGYLRTSLAYMNVVLTSGFVFLLPTVLAAALSARGSTQAYRNFLVAGFFANLLLNPTLMWGWIGLPALGVSGIALATVIVQAGGAVYLWRELNKPGFSQDMQRSDFRPHGRILRSIAGQAVPAALNMLTVAAGIFLITWFVKHFGKEAVAAIGIATRIEQILLMPTIGLNTAVMSLVGQNHGAGLPARVREVWVTNLRIGAGLMILGGLLLWAFREPAMRLFTRDPIVIGHGRNYLLSSACTLAAYPILFVTVFAMQGIKRPAYGMWMGLYRQIAAPWLVFHTLAFTLGWGLWGIWWGISLVTWSAALFAVFWGRRIFGRLGQDRMHDVASHIR